MAFTIRIFEKDEYIYSLLKYRLGVIYPDAYIVNPMTGDNQDISGGISDHTITFYDQRYISAEDIGEDTAFPLVDPSGTINCRKLISSVDGASKDGRLITRLSDKGMLTALIPFVPLDVREDYITRFKADEMPGTTHAIRLDYTDGLRSSPESISGVKGNMTELLQAATSRKFMPEDILNYCALDNTGFLTPGMCSGTDDILDTDPNVLIRLADSLSRLVHIRENSISALLVIEGIRSSTISRITASCDRAVILCPKIRSDSYKELKDTIERNMLSGTADIIRIDSYREDRSYEQIM